MVQGSSGEECFTKLSGHSCAVEPDYPGPVPTKERLPVESLKENHFVSILQILWLAMFSKEIEYTHGYVMY